MRLVPSGMEVPPGTMVGRRPNCFRVGQSCGPMRSNPLTPRSAAILQHSSRLFFGPTTPRVTACFRRPFRAAAGPAHAGRIFNSFLIAIGVSMIFVAIGAMTQTIVEMEFGEAFSQRRNKRMIDKLENHFIICGYGRVGRGAAEELHRAKVPFVITELNPDRVQRAMMAGMV